MAPNDPATGGQAGDQGANVAAALTTSFASMSASFALQNVLVGFPEFDGKNMPLKDFLQDVRNGLEFAGGDQEPRYVRAVLTKLKGAARDCTYGKTIRTIEDLVKVLKERFAPGKDFAYYCNKIHQIYMRQGEKVGDFYDHLNILLAGAKNALELEVGAANIEVAMKGTRIAALNQFISKLPPDIRMAIQTLNPETLDAAYKEAVRLEAKRDAGSAPDFRFRYNNRLERRAEDFSRPIQNLPPRAYPSAHVGMVMPGYPSETLADIYEAARYPEFGTEEYGDSNLLPNDETPTTSGPYYPDDDWCSPPFYPPADVNVVRSDYQPYNAYDQPRYNDQRRFTAYPPNPQPFYNQGYRMQPGPNYPTAPPNLSTADYHNQGAYSNPTHAGQRQWNAPMGWRQEGPKPAGPPRQENSFPLSRPGYQAPPDNQNGRLYVPRTGIFETSRPTQGNWRAPAGQDLPSQSNARNPNHPLNSQAARPEMSPASQNQKSAASNQTGTIPKVMHIMTRPKGPLPLRRAEDLKN